MNLKLMVTKWIPDKIYLQMLFYKHFRRFIDFRNPKTYNEKLQWLKLYDRNPKYTRMVDKYEAKKYVSEVIGEEFVIPTIGVWESPEEINFDELPSQFVLKWNHDSGSVVICKDKKAFDKEEAIKKLQQGKKFSGYWYGREWPYKNVRPLILAEQYMEDTETEELRDYKFFCFNGVAKALFVATDRQVKGVETKFDFFDMEYKHLPVTNGHPNADTSPLKPKCFEDMKVLAEKLSVGIPHLRVDFYEVNGNVYFGELTFSHWSGLVPFKPEEWDYKFGEWLELPMTK